MKENKIYKAAIYVRLSKEDGDVSDASKVESNSISNQKELIKEFLKTKSDIEVVSERVDDGYSGVNFDRPAFQLMLEDIKQGKIDCVVVKDLSRFGRNYIESGRYIEKIFPMLGVRFIAINDNYDSLVGKSQTDEIVIPFKNLINDAYCRDISIKIRSHLDVKRRKGEFIGSFTIYGYKKDEDNHNTIVIDEYAAGIVSDERYAGHMVSHKKVYEAFDMANANMQKSSRGKRVNLANKKNYSVIICPYCGLTLRPGNQRDLYMYCPTGRMHKESKCQEVRIKKSVVEETLVKLVRSQAEMLITAEKILNQRNKGNTDYKNPQSLVLQCKAELTKLETDKVLCYENYKTDKISRDDFKEKKKLLDSRKQELIMSIEELEARVITECKEEKQQNAALEIKKYVHLEKYDKTVMAALITKVEVLDEDTINVVWKYQSEYDKILAVL